MDGIVVKTCSIRRPRSNAVDCFAREVLRGRRKSDRLWRWNSRRKITLETLELPDRWIKDRQCLIRCFMPRPGREGRLERLTWTVRRSMAARTSRRPFGFVAGSTPPRVPGQRWISVLLGYWLCWWWPLAVSRLPPAGSRPWRVRADSGRSFNAVEWNKDCGDVALSIGLPTHTHTHTITRCHPRLDCDWLWKLSAKGRNEAYGGTIGKLRYCPRSCGATERARWIIQTYSLAADLILDSHYGSVGLNEDPRRIVDPRNLVTRPGLKVMQRSRASEFCVFFWFQRISFVSIELRPITLRQSSSEALGRILDPLKSVACSSWKVMQQPLASEFFLVSMDSVISVLCNRYQSYCDYFFR